jgi:hypothetical protein
MCNTTGCLSQGFGGTVEEWNTRTPDPDVVRLVEAAERVIDEHCVDGGPPFPPKIAQLNDRLAPFRKTIEQEE